MPNPNVQAFALNVSLDFLGGHVARTKFGLVRLQQTPNTNSCTINAHIFARRLIGGAIGPTRTSGDIDLSPN
jgi:hypothetical protein